MNRDVDNALIVAQQHQQDAEASRAEVAQLIADIQADRATAWQRDVLQTR